MKFILAFTFLVSSSLFAQQEYFEYGFKGGVNISNVTGGNTAFDSRTSMNIGGYGLYKILPKLGIQAELLYSEQGFSNDYPSDIPEVNEVNEVLRMQYLNLPVLGSYNLIENLWIEGGVQVGYLVKAELEQEQISLDDLNSVNSNTTTIAQTDTYERVDLSAAGGLRYKLNRNFMLQARYNKSLSDINKNLSGEQFNEVWSFSVGFVF
jgi:hypothetical protein